MFAERYTKKMQMVNTFRFGGSQSRPKSPEFTREIEELKRIYKAKREAQMEQWKLEKKQVEVSSAQ